jgi:WD40 repeat protein
MLMNSRHTSLKVIACVLILLTLTTQIARAQSTVPDYPVTHIVVSGDATRLAVLGRTTQNSAGKIVYYADILDATTLEILSSVDIGTNPPSLFDVSPDAGWLVYGVPYTELRAINVVTGESVVLFPRGVIEIDALDWNPVDGRVAYAEGAAVNVVDVYAQHEGTSLFDRGSPGLVQDVAWSINGVSLATSTYFDSASMIQIWNAEQLAANTIVDEPLSRFPGGGRLVWSPDGDILASGTREFIEIFDMVTEEKLFDLILPDEFSPASIVWSPDNLHLAVGSADIILIWDTTTGELANTIAVTGIIDAMVWLPDLGIVHNGDGNGLYLNGELVTAPIVSTDDANLTATPSS